MTPVVLIALAMLGGATWWILWNWQLNQDLANEIAKVRVRGEPLTTLELNDYYQPARGGPDMTKEILTAFELSKSPDLQPLGVRLPIVGNPSDFGFPEEVPPVSESWGQLAEIEAYLAKQAVPLATFHEVARRQGRAHYPSDYSAGLHTLLGHLNELRDASRLLSLEFHVHLHHGRPSQAVDSILAQLALSQTLEGDPSMPSQLVRVALGNEAIKLMQRGMKETIWSDADLARLQGGLREFQFTSALRDALVGERASAFTACFDPQKMIDPKSNPTADEVREMISHPPQRLADAAKILEIHRRLIESSEHPISESIRSSRELQADLATIGKNPVTQLTYIMTLLLVPATFYAPEAIAAAAARRDSADAVIAAELYRRKYDKWPEKLEQLRPEFLPGISNDPFTDEPFQMKVSPDGIKVYSVGNDEVDNGGILSDASRQGNDIGFEAQVRVKP